VSFSFLSSFFVSRTFCTSRVAGKRSRPRRTRFVPESQSYTSEESRSARSTDRTVFFQGALLPRWYCEQPARRPAGAVLSTKSISVKKPMREDALETRTPTNTPVPFFVYMFSIVCFGFQCH